jgi:hypothetical protein
MRCRPGILAAGWVNRAEYWRNELMRYRFYFALTSVVVALLFAGCGSPPEEAGAPAAVPPTRPLPGRSVSAELPSRKVNATWGGSIRLTSYDVSALGGDRYRISLTLQCLRKVDLNWARITRLKPANPAALETKTERSQGTKIWDGAFEPPTSTWQPGKTYMVAIEGSLPDVGAPWSVMLGMVEWLDGRPTGRRRTVPLTDPGNLKRLGQTEEVVLTSIGNHT